MKHLTEEELIDMYYGEREAVAAEHLRSCRECSAQMAELRRGLEGATSVVVPQKGLEYGEQVWEALRPQLIPYRSKARGWHGLLRGNWAQWKFAALAIGCAAVVAAAFVGGRVWERHTKGTTTATNTGLQAKQRVVLVVLTDHLDRTERLLVALEHADASDRTENAQLQSEARDLLASNRLYRATASEAGDPVVAGALDRLQGVLAEIANDPTLTAEDLQRVRNEMNTEGILFEIRVLLAQKPDQPGGAKSAKGATI
ncbi:MAG: hypothetical protein ACLGXA_05265 [Acidobacteriota bacterium]